MLVCVIHFLFMSLVVCRQVVVGIKGFSKEFEILYTR